MRSAAGHLPSIWTPLQARAALTVATVVWNGGSAMTSDIDSWTGETTSRDGVNELYFSFAQHDTRSELFFDGRERHSIRGGSRHVLFIPASSQVRMQVHSHRAVDALAIRLTNEFMAACAEKGDKALRALHPALDAMDEVDWLFAGVIREECRRGAPNGMMGVEAAAAMLARSLIRRASGLPSCPQAPRGGLSPKALQMACEYMTERLGERIALAELASLVGFSIGHFALAFKQSTGVTPHRWLRLRRIERAKLLLVGGKFNVSEVALIVGFSNQSSFGEAFRQEIGLPPVRWLRGK